MDEATTDVIFYAMGDVPYEPKENVLLPNTLL